MPGPVPSPPIVRPTAPVTRVGLRCDACEVTWRGLRDDPCWSCGRPGTPHTNVIIVPG
jgi:hypothetical protein